MTSKVVGRPPKPTEATKAVRGNMYMDTRVIKVADDFKSEVILKVVWRMPWPKRPAKYLFEEIHAKWGDKGWSDKG